MKSANSLRGRGEGKSPPLTKGASLTVAYVFERTAFTCASVWQMFEAARELAGRGRAVVALSRPDREMVERCSASGIPHLPLPLRHRADVASMRGLARLAAEQDVRVVHTHRGVALEAALGAPLFGARFALLVDRGVTFPPGALARVRYRSRRLSRVVASCEAVRRVLVDEAGIPPAKVAVVHAGTDLARWDPRRTDRLAARAALGIAADRPLIGHVGLRVWKGWKELLLAFPAVRRERPDAHLVLVSCRTTRQRDAVLSLAAEMGLAGSVSATLAGQDLPSLLAACDVVVDASWAGTGISGSIREAMALGCPVVATACGGTPELVEDGVSGILVPPRDVPTLAAAIARVLRDTDLASRLAGAGRERVRAGFSTTRRVDRLEELYQATAGEAVTSPA